MPPLRDPRTGKFVKGSSIPDRGPLGVHDVDKGYDAAMASLLELDGTETTDVGVFDADNALKAAMAELGTATAKARPFMSTAFDMSRDELERDITRALGRQIDAGRGSKRAALARAAEDLKKRIELSIDSWTEPPNAPSTIKQKGRNKPLEDMGDLLRSIEIKEGLT